MDSGDNRVIDIGTRLKASRDRDGAELASERIRNLAYQATKLPTTLSRAQIEELGHAVLMHARLPPTDRLKVDER